jgi:hypothetical protein
MCHNAAMPYKPNIRKARGYDVVVWVDGDGDIVATSYSVRGVHAMLRIVPSYVQGDIVEILMHPDKFTEIMHDMKVGYMRLDRKIVQMGEKSPLH